MTSLENAITGNVIVYQAENESVSTNVLFKDETFWMTQKKAFQPVNYASKRYAKYAH